jgi:hypothetical protein
MSARFLHELLCANDNMNCYRIEIQILPPLLRNDSLRPGTKNGRIKGVCSKGKGPGAIKALRQLSDFGVDISYHQLTGTVIFLPKRL